MEANISTYQTALTWTPVRGSIAMFGTTTTIIITTPSRG